MIRFNSAGRVQAIEGMYLVHPGTCLLCGKVPDSGVEYFASLGVELEYFGACYLCQACCAEIADFIGFVSPDNAEELQTANDNLYEANKKLHRSLQTAKGLLDARINSASDNLSDEHGSPSIPLFETEPDSDFVDRILNRDKPESA
jgi:hypothetical protein